MKDLQHIVRRAARRELLGRALHRGGVLLSIALAAALALLLVDRLLGLPLPAVVYVAVAATGLAAGLGSAMAAGSNRLAVAIRLDRALDLRDRLGTALALTERSPAGGDKAFAELVRQDAERAAGRLDVRAATPVRITGVWGTAAFLAVLLLLGGVFIPRLDWTSRARAARSDADIASLDHQRAELAESIRDAAETIEPEAAVDERVREDVSALENLAAQLTDPEETTIDPEAARRETAERLNDAAESGTRRTPRTP